MIPRLGKKTAITLTIICVLLIALWVRSRRHASAIILAHRQSSELFYQDRSAQLWVESGRVILNLHGFFIDHPSPRVRAAFEQPGATGDPIGWSLRYHAFDDDDTLVRIMVGSDETWLNRIGFGWDSDLIYFDRKLNIQSKPGPGDLGTERTRHVMIPIWSILLACGIFPAVRLTRHIRRKRRARSFRCAMCGYDLRATPERCPECGAMPMPPAPSPGDAIATESSTAVRDR